MQTSIFSKFAHDYKKYKRRQVNEKFFVFEREHFGMTLKEGGQDSVELCSHGDDPRTPRTTHTIPNIVAARDGTIGIV